jgi:RNA-binding protein
VVLVEFLGVVETVSGEGRFVVKAETAPEAGEQIFDEKGSAIGTVKRIFGPVDGPYVTVSSREGTSLDGIVGKKVFYRGENRHGKTKRKH